MGIFDNAKSITIGEKVVKSITVDGGVIYEADEPTPPTPTKNIEILVTSKSTAQTIQNAEVIIDNDSSMKGITDDGGTVNISVPLGEHTVVVTADGYEQTSKSIEVDEIVSMFYIQMNTAEPQE